MRKLISILLFLIFIVSCLSSCASSKGGGWYKNRNNTYLEEQKQRDFIKDGPEEFLSEAEEVLVGEK